MKSPCSRFTSDARASTFLLASVAKLLHSCWSASAGTHPSISSCCTGSTPCITWIRCPSVSRRCCLAFLSPFSSSTEPRLAE